jgi:hypothetical protein
MAPPASITAEKALVGTSTILPMSGPRRKGRDNPSELPQTEIKLVLDPSDLLCGLWGTTVLQGFYASPLSHSLPTQRLG